MMRLVDRVVIVIVVAVVFLVACVVAVVVILILFKFCTAAAILVAVNALVAKAVSAVRRAKTCATAAPMQGMVAAIAV